MSRRLLVSIFALLILLARPASAVAQEYLFAVDRETVDVFWNADGTSSLEYTFDFTNQASRTSYRLRRRGHADQHVRHVHCLCRRQRHARERVSERLSGKRLRLFRRAWLVRPFSPEPSGTVHVLVGRITGVLHPDSSDANYASAVFAPTYFGSKYVVGSTDLTVTFHLPPGVKPEEPRYHMAENWPGSPEPQADLDAKGRITYAWSAPNASAASQYTFGASFPKSYVPADAIVTAPTFDFGAVISWMASNFGTVACCGLFAFLFVGMPILGVIQGQRRKLQYLPPRISIEGHGIKRGLTAVEAAILLEQPLDKVLTMTLFGTVKKGAAKVASRDPAQDRCDRSAARRPPRLREGLPEGNGARQSGAAQKGLETMMIALVKAVAEKMKGFSRKETQDYYKNIMEQAWAQVEAAQTPEVKGAEDRSRISSGPCSTPITTIARGGSSRVRSTFPCGGAATIPPGTLHPRRP